MTDTKDPHNTCCFPLKQHFFTVIDLYKLRIRPHFPKIAPAMIQPDPLEV